MEGRKFVGLVNKIHVSHQQNNFPLIAYIGCKYHAEYLESDEQKRAFKDFDVKSITQRVAELRAIPTCNTLLGILPAPQIEAKVSLLKSMNPLDVDALLDSFPDAEATKVGQRLKALIPACP